jgi:hypothetical protein
MRPQQFPTDISLLLLLGATATNTITMIDDNRVRLKQVFRSRRAIDLRQTRGIAELVALSRADQGRGPRESQASEERYRVLSVYDDALVHDIGASRQ